MAKKDRIEMELDTIIILGIFYGKQEKRTMPGNFYMGRGKAHHGVQSASRGEGEGYHKDNSFIALWLSIEQTGEK